MDDYYLVELDEDKKTLCHSNFELEIKDTHHYQPQCLMTSIDDYYALMLSYRPLFPETK